MKWWWDAYVQTGLSTIFAWPDDRIDGAELKGSMTEGLESLRAVVKKVESLDRSGHSLGKPLSGQELATCIVHLQHISSHCSSSSYNVILYFYSRFERGNVLQRWHVCIKGIRPSLKLSPMHYVSYTLFILLLKQSHKMDSIFFFQIRCAICKCIHI